MYWVSHYINGQTVPDQTRSQVLTNPSTGERIGHVSLGNAAIVERAVAAAKAAFLEWSAVTPLKRARILSQYKVLLEKNIDSLAKLVSTEHGKTLTDARGSVQRGIEVVEFVCGIPHLLTGSYTAEVATGVDSYSLKQPLGVCAGITPFNFPAMIPLWMFPMAVACGNTFILKPSEKDPSCAIRLVELAEEAGLPKGVVNVVQGDKEVVDALLSHSVIQAISFVGSTPIAEYVYHTATQHGKRVQAFGGAKNHCVVMPDADLDQAADAIIGAAYGSAGERCMAISVVVAVGDMLADALVAKLSARTVELKIGSGLENDVDMGPLVTQVHLDKVKNYIKLGVDEGAELLVDGRAYHSKTHPNGFYLGPCLFDHVKIDMRIYQEEIFGPVLCVVRVPDFASALALINQHTYGNGTAIFTSDGNAAREFASQVQVGMVGINIPIPVPVAHHSFGGWKRSIFGDIPMHGMEGVRFYTKLKTVTQRWLKSTKPENLFAMPTHDD